MKCGLIEKTESQFVDTIEKEAYVWCEKTGSMMIMNISIIGTAYLCRRRISVFSY
jgi:hypothetical protein